MAADDVLLDFDVKVSRIEPFALAHLDSEVEPESSAGKLLCAEIATNPGAVERSLRRRSLTSCRRKSLTKC